MSPVIYADLPAVSTVDSTARLLDVSTDTVYALIASGELGHVRLGRSIRVARHHVVAFLTRDGAEESGP